MTTKTDPAIQAAGAWKYGVRDDAETDPSKYVEGRRIFALPDSVRVPCKCFGFYRAGVIGSEWHKSANGLKGLKRWPDCHGLGYTPSTDLAVWIKAALGLETWEGVLCAIEFSDEECNLSFMDKEDEMQGSFHAHGEPLKTLQSVLVLVLGSDGWTLGGRP